MENQKITKRERFEEMRTMFADMGRTDLVDFVNHELELLAKKSATRSKKDDAKAQANEECVDIVATILEKGKKTISEIIKSDERFADFSTPKMSAIVKIGITKGLFVRTEEKGKAYFSLV